MFQFQDLTKEKHQGGGCCHFCHERVLGYEVYLHRRSSHDFIFSGKRMLHLADIQAVANGSGQVELQKVEQDPDIFLGCLDLNIDHRAEWRPRNHLLSSTSGYWSKQQQHQV